jgi:hypothetical protein
MENFELAKWSILLVSIVVAIGFIAAATVAIMSFKNNPTGTSQQL